MLQYPTIQSWRKSPIGKPCIAFNKYDGSNLRWEYSPKQGWNKMGTRRCMFDKNTPLYNQSIELFHDSGMAQSIVDATNHFHGRKVERITAFTEFYGQSSFAGTHDPDEAKTLTLFDVFVFKKGFVPPKQFVKLFGKQDWCAQVVYQGNFNQSFIDDVRSGLYPVYEGVICKGEDWVAKVKTLAYLERLKSTHEALWNLEKDE